MDGRAALAMTEMLRSPWRKCCARHDGNAALAM